MAFRILNQSPVYLDNAGEPLAGGTLTFSNTGTSTPKTAYSDKALTTPVANPLTLDSAGRAPVDLWGSGSYRVVLKNSAGVTIKTLDDVDELVSGVTLPTPVINQFVTSTDGSTFSMAAIRQLPDPTGGAGKVVWTADGVNYTLRNFNAFSAVSSVASASTITPDAGYDLTVITALAVPATIANPSGTWGQGQAAVVRIKDNGTGRALSFGAKFRAIGVTLPTTTVANKTLYIAFIYNSTDDKFDVTGVGQEA